LRGMSEPLYQAFVGRAYRLGYTAVEPEDKGQKTEFYKDEQYICDLMPNGEIRYMSGTGVDNDVQKLTDLLLSMKPAYSLYADAAYLQCDGVKNYKLLCDFGDYLLAANLSKDNELSFVTWRYEYSRDSVVLGHYFNTNYEAAKEDFAVRCGLVDGRKIFNEEEILYLDTACAFGNYGDYLDRLEDSTAKEEFEKLMDKLESLLPPELLEQIPEPEQEQEDQSEMEAF